MPLKTRNLTKWCYDLWGFFLVMLLGSAIKQIWISKDYTCWVQAVTKQKSHVNKTGVSAHMQSGSRGWFALLWDVLLLGWHSDSTSLLGLLLSVSATNIPRPKIGRAHV